ncbi:MAG: pyrroloquinoline quinone-dependent dehydrogenase [Acidobacterium sp.]|nr:pyrroloquinoline quinone-dependent dehydrogenase [Acidobacteriota bacterium]PHY08464.1 MAG: pyrroloquinoline quinone-dependent dehydrogenase [Acidobacterium sp.]
MRKVGVLIALTVCLNGASGAQSPPVGEWTHYGGNAASQKYSALDQINKDTVGKLKIAWRWTSSDNAVVAANPLSRPGMYHDTPLMVKGVLYTVTSLGQIVALNPATGASLWVFDPANWKSGRPGNLGFVHRGISYWTDGTKERLLLGTSDAYLISVDAKSGALDTTFGQGGRIDLMAGLANAVRSTNYSVTAAPIICRDVVVVGASIHDGPTHKEWPRGDVSGFDVRTGKRLWTLHSIPQKGEFGNETWGDDSFSYSGSTNVWTNMSADEELGYVYLPFGTPTDDWFGGHRPGANLFAESLVALDVKTGKRMWHFQAVHHGIWDYDLPAAPVLADIRVDGKVVKAVAQVSKQGFTYVFDRRTGVPVWPIEERPVPQSTVPGERSSPTQPFPTKPPAFERQGVTESDLIDFTPELKQAALAAIKPFEYGPLFTPPTEKGTIALPGWVGGANWAGAAFDPEQGTLYIPSLTSPIVIQLVKPDPTKSNLLYVRGGVQAPPTLDGLPVVKPPYGRVTAIDLNKGDTKWVAPVGDGPRNHPLLKDLNLPALGAALRNAPMVTKSLLFIATGQGNLGGGRALPVGGRPLTTGLPAEPVKLRAFDKATGALLWEFVPPSQPLASPMTYSYQGVQYLVVAAGSGPSAELIAFTLGS